MAEKLNIFLDMDNTLVNTLPVLNRATDLAVDFGVEKPDQIPGIFRNLEPIDGAVAGVQELADRAELYILTTAPWNNVSSWSDKLAWLTEHFGNGPTSPFYKKVIMAHTKDVARGKGGILIDDRPYHGAAEWDSEKYQTVWIQYGYDERLTWDRELPAFLTLVANLAASESLDARTAVTSVNTRFKYALSADDASMELADWEMK
jgi:5'-nucleotidase